jgi:hypothetical protein
VKGRENEAEFEVGVASWEGSKSNDSEQPSPINRGEEKAKG